MQTETPRGSERRDWNRAQSLRGTVHRRGVLGGYMSGNPTNQELKRVARIERLESFPERLYTTSHEEREALPVLFTAST
jgi:hypothetical protein